MSTSASHYSGHSCKGPPSTSITKIHTRCEWLFSKKNWSWSRRIYRLYTFTHAWYHQALFPSSVISLSFDGSLKLHFFHRYWWWSCVAPLQSFRRCGVLLSSLCSDSHCQIIPVPAHALCRNALTIRSQWPESWSFKLCFVFRKFLLALSENYSIQLDVFSCSSWSNKISDDHRLTNRPGWRLSDYQIRARVLVECGPS